MEIQNLNSGRALRSYYTLSCPQSAGSYARCRGYSFWFWMNCKNLVVAWKRRPFGRLVWHLVIGRHPAPFKSSQWGSSYQRQCRFVFDLGVIGALKGLPYSSRSKFFLSLAWAYLSPLALWSGNHPSYSILAWRQTRLVALATDGLSDLFGEQLRLQCCSMISACFFWRFFLLLAGPYTGPQLIFVDGY